MAARGCLRRQNISLLADRCSSMRQLCQIHAQMLVSGRILDAFAASRLLSFAALHPSGSIPYSLLFFHNHPHPNSFMSNTLLFSLASSPSPSQTFQFFSCTPLPPGKHTFPFLLKASARLTDGLSAVTQIHGQVVKRGFHEDLYVGNGLIIGYSVFGKIGLACEVFGSMPDRNSVVWTTMVGGYVKNERYADALRAFERMVTEERLEPCPATLSSVLSACARSGELELGRRVHGVVVANGMALGVILGTALIDMYAKNGEIEEAMALFRRVPERNIATWNAVICGCSHHGHPKCALDLFAEMEKKGFPPNDVTFVGVLSACCHAGLVETGRQLFDSMESKHGIEPAIEHYGCIVNLLGRCGRFEAAVELIEGMKWEPDVVMLGSLLDACKNHGNMAMAERVAREMLRVDSGNAGVYVALSDAYAAVGKWEQVDGLRRRMKNESCRKLPGSSLVDGVGQVGNLKNFKLI